MALERKEQWVVVVLLVVAAAAAVLREEKSESITLPPFKAFAILLVD